MMIIMYGPYVICLNQNCKKIWSRLGDSDWRLIEKRNLRAIFERWQSESIVYG